MPNLKEHSENSKKRTGKEFKELHEWMDEGAKYLGEDHRFERHSNAYLKYVRKKWGVEGEIEFINHIIDDYKMTLSVYDTIADLPEDEKLLYMELKDLRKQMSITYKTSTAAIFNNKILREICIKQPVTTEQLKEIPGVSADKIKKYGQEFISLIQFKIIEEESKK